mgnify:FL=1
MDFGIGSVTAITAICYLGGMACKATTKVKDEVIPVVCGVTGGILGVAGMYLMPEFPATDVINAAAIGIVSGWQQPERTRSSNRQARSRRR